MALGTELTKQLGQAADRDLLARWMVEYVAERLSLLRSARGAKRLQESAECADLILRLWDHRHSLPDGGRPLASFEPLFRALQSLSGEEPRYGMLGDLPKATAGSEVERNLAVALTLDRAASALLRYFLAEAVARVPEKDKRWARLRANIGPAPLDIQIILAATRNAETLSEKRTRLRKTERDELKGMIDRLEAFEAVSQSVRAVLQARLKTT